MKVQNIHRLLLLVCFISLVTNDVSAQSLREVFKRVNASVVVVHTREEVSDRGSAPNIASEPSQEQGIGSGVLIAADGKVLTAAHVIKTADHIEVEFLDGTRMAARVLAVAPAADLAMLQIERLPANAVIARLSDSNLVESGDQVFAIGAPYSARHSLAVGWVSARRTAENVLENLSALETLQIDLALYQGNSGGPLFNLAGEVVGIVTHVLTKGEQTTGPGFAVASNTVRRLMLEEKQSWLGFEALLLENVLAQAFNLPQSAGLLVQSVAMNSLGAQLGLRESKLPVQIGEQVMFIGGDILLEMNGIPVRPDYASVKEMQKRLNALRTGEPLVIKAWRGGAIVELKTLIP